MQYALIALACLFPKAFDDCQMESGVANAPQQERIKVRQPQQTRHACLYLAELQRSFVSSLMGGGRFRLSLVILIMS